MADGEFRHAGGQAESSGSGTIARRAALEKRHCRNGMAMRMRLAVAKTLFY